MWHDVVVICQLLDDVAIDNWWMWLLEIITPWCVHGVRLCARGEFASWARQVYTESRCTRVRLFRRHR
jgi:hypothetical protein